MHAGALLITLHVHRWIIDYNEIQVGKQVGMGSYGLVHHGRWKGIEVAVKRFIKQKLTERRLLEFRAEMAFLSELNHPNVVVFIGTRTTAHSNLDELILTAHCVFRRLREEAQPVHRD
jgi:serine/threonine protein kinase